MSHATRWSEVGHRREPALTALEEPGAALLAGQLEELLDHLAMSAHESGVRELVEERADVFEGRVRKELVAKLDLKVATASQGADCFDAARVRARHDPLDHMLGKRFGQLTRIGATDPIETPRSVQAGRGETPARAGMSH